MRGGPHRRGAGGVVTAVPLLLLCYACAQPAQVILYEQRQQMAQRGVRDVQAPVPPSKPYASPSTGRRVISSAPRPVPRPSPRLSIEVSSLPPVPPKRPAPSTPTSVTSADVRAPARTQVAVNPAPPVPAASPVTQKATGAPSYQQIPADGIHVVTPKQTVYALSRLYGVPVRSLLLLNNLEPPYQLNTGQRVKIPVQRRHVVSKGETVYAISRQHDVSLAELVRLNEIPKPFTIVTGQTILLPDTQRTAVATAAPETSAPETAPPAASGNADKSRDGAQVAVATPPKPKRVVLPPSTNIPQPKKLSRSGFLWPVDGRVISRFGGKGKGLRNDGINIAAPRGAPIRAAQNGVVAYRGNQLRGFGNLLLIKHDKGYMTAYAHADKILVKRGARVKRGQVIARVGSTGSVATTQLHFEIRRGRQPIDPLRYLRRSRADIIEADAGPKG